MLKRCYECGTTVETTTKSNRVLCDECRKEHEVEREKRKYQRKVKQGVSGTVVIIFDPIPVEEGGFANGVRFPVEEYRCMVRLGALIKGTKVRVGNERVTTL